VARPPHGCVARHVLEAHRHRYPWWPHEAVACGRYHGAEYFRKRPAHERAREHHEHAHHTARHAGKPEGPAERRRKAKRARQHHEVERRLRPPPPGGAGEGEEQPPGEGQTEQEAVDARSRQPHGDVGTEEDPGQYGDPAHAEVQGEAEGAEEG
jgi:hypothetical protein